MFHKLPGRVDSNLIKFNIIHVGILSKNIIVLNRSRSKYIKHGRCQEENQGYRTFVDSVMTKSRELIAGEINAAVCQKLQVNK